MLRACYLQNSTSALVVNGWHSLDSWFIRRGLHKSVINFAKLENTSVDRLKKKKHMDTENEKYFLTVGS